MNVENDHRKEFIRLFHKTARYRHRYEVFRDFVTMSAISFHNAVLKSDELENEYMSIVDRYEKKDLERMAKLLGEVVMGLEKAHCDFLGSLFMELEIGSAKIGQFFTPYEVSKLMAQLSHGDAINVLSDRPFITLSEPTCGAGGIVIAFAETMLERGLNPQQQLWVSCIDVDHVAAMMCYLQLSLLHIPAEVVVGNTLSMEITRVMRTPAHYLGFWDAKLKHQLDVDDKQESKMLVNNEATLIVNPHSEISIYGDQLSLFDVDI